MKILIVLPRFPFPLEKGDKLRAFHQIRCLSEENEIYLCALSHNKVNDIYYDNLQPYCKEIRVFKLGKVSGALRALRNFFSIRSLQIGYWDSKCVRRKIRNYAAEIKPDVVYAQMVRTMGYISRMPYPKVLDYQDALSMNIERNMLKYRGLHYFILHYEFKMLRSAEYRACSLFDALTIISKPDAEAIPQRGHTHIDIIPNGVDFDYFRPLDIDKQYDIVFCGNMQYAPNIDASQFLIREIMPLVWKKHPEATVLLAGATPKAAVRKLAGPRVKITGWVDDIRQCYAHSRVFVAPMRIGSGMQNKLLEAMAIGTPCVTTELANASIGTKNGSEVLVGNTAESLADAIVQLLDDETKRCTIADNANRFVHEHFSWESECKALQKVFERVVNK